MPQPSITRRNFIKAIAGAAILAGVPFPDVQIEETTTEEIGPEVVVKSTGSDYDDLIISSIIMEVIFERPELVSGDFGGFIRMVPDWSVSTWIVCAHDAQYTTEVQYQFLVHRDDLRSIDGFEDAQNFVRDKMVPENVAELRRNSFPYAFA